MHTDLREHPEVVEGLRLLERANPDQFEIYFERSRSTRIESKDQKIDSVTRAEDVGMSIRVVKDQRLGFSFTTSLERSAISKAVETALEIAQLMPQDPFVGLESFAAQIYPDVDQYDSAGIAQPEIEKIELAKRLESACRKADARIAGVRSATVSENLHEVIMVDSQGESIRHQGTLFSASITCKAEGQGDSQMGGEYAFSHALETLEIDSTARMAAQWATELLGAQAAPTLQCPAVLRNSVVAELVQFLSSSFSAEHVDKGRSLLADKRGQNLFSEKVTLVDDGLLASGYATSPFDGEGIPSAKKILVDGGTIKDFLYDGYYARKMGATPTGNASRGVKSPPSIDATNLYLLPGKKSVDSLIQGITRGILITELMGLHTANPITGDFSLGASGLLIEGGKITRPVRGFAVAGNVLELFRRMTDIGNDLRFFGGTGAPSVRVSEISVGGT